ncbi:MAG: lipopolysaccharide export system protein LptA [Alphaproteobacteria bacterium]|nr:lipopolysaccharide export system protein LptA [Alphaproteobacteria bacterium]
MMRASCGAMFFACAAIASAAFVCAAHAQTARPPAQRAAQANQGPANALQGFSQNRDQPVQIEAASLEVRDKDKVATFSGNVHVIQGDTDLRSKTLVVYYEEDNPKAGAIKAAQPGPGGSSQIKRLEASGSVLVTQKDQTATGDKGVFDMRTNTITLTGNVVISQGQNVLRGERLIVDRATGVSRMEGGRVQGIFQRGKEDGSPALKLPGTN